MTCPAPLRKDLVPEDFDLSLDAHGQCGRWIKYKWTMGRLGGWLGAGGGNTTLPCLAGSGCRNSESYYLSGSGEEGGQGMGTGYV